MRVTLITEGTYPIHPGGVGDWCDQLVRGLPDIEFEVAALSGSGLEPETYDLPPNITAVRRIGLWAPPRLRSRRPFDRRFLHAYEQLIESSIVSAGTATDQFAEGVRRLRELVPHVDLTTALCSQDAVDVVVDVAARVPDLEPTLADALAITDTLEHFLRPLQLEPPRSELVHTTANGPGTLLALLAKWEHGVPVLLSEHGVYLRERLLSTRSSGATRTQRAALHGFYAGLTGLGYREADAVLPVSHFNARWALQGGAAPETVQVLHNGVDPAELPLLDGEPDTPTLVFAGRIDPLKDVHMLLRAFALVRERIPAARLRLFGGTPTGNEDYRSSCESLARALDLDGSVSFEGPVSPVRRAFEAGHVVVLSSVSEGLPLTIIEAAMCGRATVATDVGGMAEAVGGGGIVVPAGDAYAFADACVGLLTDDERRWRLAAVGRRHALDSFTLDRFLGAMRGLYEHHGAEAAARRPVVAPRELAVVPQTGVPHWSVSR